MNVFEDFPYIRLDLNRLFAIGKDLQQVVVYYKVEPSEVLPFFFKELNESLFDLSVGLIVVGNQVEVVPVGGVIGPFPEIGGLLADFKQFFELELALLEQLGFLGEVFERVGRVENRLKEEVLFLS